METQPNGLGHVMVVMLARPAEAVVGVAVDRGQWSGPGWGCAVGPTEDPAVMRGPPAVVFVPRVLIVLVQGGEAHRGGLLLVQNEKKFQGADCVRPVLQKCVRLDLLPHLVQSLVQAPRYTAPPPEEKGPGTPGAARAVQVFRLR